MHVTRRQPLNRAVINAFQIYFCSRKLFDCVQIKYYSAFDILACWTMAFISIAGCGSHTYATENNTCFGRLYYNRLSLDCHKYDNYSRLLHANDADSLEF